MFIMHVLSTQLHFLVNTKTELAVPPLLWPVNCIKISEHVALLSGRAVCSLYRYDTNRITQIGTTWKLELHYNHLQMKSQIGATV